MPQLFKPSTNTLARVSLFGALGAVAFLLWLLAAFAGSGWITRENVPRTQPVAFSHEHHVGADGIDCRYCHTSVERSAFAGIPPARTCMNCHAQIWATSPALAPVRESMRTDRPIRWTRVHDLPDFVYFHHGIHVQKGIGCSTCHGRVDRMPLTMQVVSLQMRWCLDCHRRPERWVRPRAEVFSMEWQPPPEQAALGRKLVAQYGIAGSALLTSCDVCHR
ncbi:MAG: cytochrome c3 family protein [Deltaproteobacteria bacterium]|nr:cytochrome c3 family protein [Deltaproteobacteria bacterium]